jgi:3-oxoacyl-[acyl-carrier protein] reductase
LPLWPATNAAIIALAKAFAEQRIKDAVQAPAHNITVEEATSKFSEQAGISRYGQPEEIAAVLGFPVSPAAKWMRDCLPVLR